MGLCKCPKRKVTNQFCFEHRVNVCEYCMVTNHPKCIVQSYLQWLQDSDCNPICTLCSNTLKDGDCIRLTCYHVFHWRCLDVYARNLPATTAPAGYVCPACHSPIFPETNLISPVADVLKEKLASVNWARAGLGLPLLSSDREQKPGSSGVETTRYHPPPSQPAPTQPQPPPPLISSSSSASSASSSASSSLSSSASSLMSSPNVLPSVATARITNNNINTHSNSVNNNLNNNQKQGPPYSIVNIESSAVQSNKKIFEAYDDPKDISFDHDENKYQRKSFLRWWKLITSQAMRKRGSFNKNLYIFIAGIIFFIFIIILFSWLNRVSIDSDINEFGDIGFNPNINIQKEPAAI